MVNIVAVLFDIDGTILKNEDLHYEATKIASEKLGVDLSYELWQANLGKGHPVVFEALKPKFDAMGSTISVTEFCDSCMEEYGKIIDRVPARKGMRRFIADLNAKGKATGAVTNAISEYAKKGLAAVGIMPFFGRNFIGLEELNSIGMLHMKKPNPYPYDYMRSFMGVTDSHDPNAPYERHGKKGHVVVFEDSAGGVEAGLESGAITIQFVEGPIPAHPDADYHIRTQEEFEQIQTMLHQGLLEKRGLQRPENKLPRDRRPLGLQSCSSSYGIVDNPRAATGPR